MTMNKRTITNPINAQPQCLPGRQLSADWKVNTAEYGGTFDRRPLEELWKQPMSAKPSVESLTRNARLQPLSWNEVYGQK